MKTLSPFASFERGLKADHAAEEAHKLEVLGIEAEPAKPAKKRGRKPLEHPPMPHVTVNLPGELAAQLDLLGDVLGVGRTAFMRLALSAATEAVLLEIEANGRVTLPLCLQVAREPRGRYYPSIRVVTPERFESLRFINPQTLQKWKSWKWNHGDRTGELMPAPAVPPVPARADAR